MKNQNGRKTIFGPFAIRVRNNRTIPCWVAHLTLLGLGLYPVQSAEKIPPEQLEFFESKIRPVLAQECYECHNSREKAKSGLVLDYRDGLLKGGDLGPGLVPGKPDESILMEALRHEYDLTMPKAGVKLDPPIIDDFEKWIAMGAPDPRDKPPTDEELAKDTSWESILETRKNWWSFQPIAPPAKKQSVDELLQAKIDAAGLQPTAPAKPETIARRLYFALIGLPPTPEEMANFTAVAKEDPQKALTDLTDQLLASPHFGERWARHWMDWIRYAESHGSEGDPRINNAHLYRDYLIRALNSDVPYDQLLLEHVAGDLLEQPRINSELSINESAIATAHWRMVFHGFAPTDALDEKVRFTDDQINTFTKAFQGLTVSCARCHDHKFDAISQADYYALFGIFGSTRPGRKMIDLPDRLEKNKKELAALKPEIRQAVAADLLASLDGLPERLEKGKEMWKDAKSPQSLLHIYWLADKQKKKKDEDAVMNHWIGLRTAWDKTKQNRAKWKTMEAKQRWDLTSDEEAEKWFRYGNALNGSTALAGEFTISTEKDKAIGQVLPRGVYTNLLSDKHGARFTSTDFALDDEYMLFVRARGGGAAMVRYVVQNYPRRGTVFKVVGLGEKGRDDWKWHPFDVSYWNGDEIHIELATARDAPLLTKDNDRSWFGIREAMLVKKDAELKPTADVRENQDVLFETAGESEVKTLQDVGENFQDALRVSLESWRDGKASDADAILIDDALALGVLPNDLASFPTAKAKIEAYRKLESEIQAPTRVHGLDEWVAANQPLYDRGDHKKPLEDVPRRFLDAVDPSPYKTDLSGRLELADNLLREDNPFTRRVIVNRIWTHLFGNGLVGTADNFGRMGEKPSHPELLDHLAVQFSDEFGWSLKKMIRQLVSTAAFQRNSEASPEATEKDPANRLLSHFPVKRLEAEAVRDTLLAVSGNLDRNLYGSPVNGSSSRRSVYVNVIRNNLDPFLSVYDAPIPFSTTGKRAETNVPAQSLTMLNNPFVVSAANRFAGETKGDDVERIQKMWKAALGRKASPDEETAAGEFIGSLREQTEEIAAKRAEMDLFIQTLEKKKLEILSPARKKLHDQLAAKQDAPTEPVDLNPVAHWKFSEGLTDQVGKANLRLVGDAKLMDGVLFLNGGFAKSQPLKQDFAAKTLEVRVQMANLDQKGGGAITLQDLQGNEFDSIVFAERKNREWLSGSNHHRRTRGFNGGPEDEAIDQSVHLVITYAGDGAIRGYRNGKPLGESYIANGIAEFKKGQCEVVLGLRHGTGPGGNRMLHGEISEARIYDRALSKEEVAALAGNESNFISKKKVLDSLTQKQRNTLQVYDEEIAALKKEQAEFGEGVGEADVWRNLAHSIFNLKEFIYVY